MKSVTIFSSAFSGSEKIAHMTSAAIGCKWIRDSEIIELVHKKAGIKQDILHKTINCSPPLRNQFTHKKNQVITNIKMILSEIISKEPVVLCGFLGQLIPRQLSMKVLINAGSSFRAQQFLRETGISGGNATKQLRMHDKQLFTWIRYLKEKSIWNESDYDVIIPSDHMTVDESVALITKAFAENSSKNEDALHDFHLETKIESLLNQKKHDIGVSVKNGIVDLIINNKVLMLNRFEKKLIKMASAIPGVQSVKTQIGKHFHRSDMVCKHEFHRHETPVYDHIEKEYNLLYQEAKQNRAENEIIEESHQEIWA